MSWLWLSIIPSHGIALLVMCVLRTRVDNTGCCSHRHPVNFLEPPIDSRGTKTSLNNQTIPAGIEKPAFSRHTASRRH